MHTAQKSALIIGASSGIGEALARRLVRRGYRVALVARRAEALHALAAELNRAATSGQGAGPAVAFAYPHDVTQYAEVPALFDRIGEELGGLSHVFYVAGIMSSVGPEDYDFAFDRPMIEVHALGMVAWLNEAADYFSRLNAGAIIGVGSVAGDRGRKGQPVYNASKAFQHSYLESLRNRLHADGVRVVTIKPGPIDTPMVRHLGQQPFMISAEQCAAAIALAGEREHGTVYVPLVWRFIMTALRLIPSFIFRRLDIR